MKKIIYTCDRCKQEIQGDLFRVYIDQLNPESEDFAFRDSYPELKEKDYCKSCADVLSGKILAACEKGAPAVINQEFEKAVQEMVATSQEEVKPEKQKLDTGKIIALHKAGWSTKAIVEEMGCNKQAVYDTIYHYKKKSPRAWTAMRGV